MESKKGNSIEKIKNTYHNSISIEKVSPDQYKKVVHNPIAECIDENDKLID